VHDDAERLATFRSGLPALAAGIYLNTGTSGPLPAETAAAMQQQSDWELTVGRGNVDGFKIALERLEELRAAAAAVVTADIDDMAVNHGTTDGMNSAIHGIDWRPGDRAITTRHEHPGGLGPLLVVRDRHGVDLDLLDVGEGGDHERVVAAFERAIDARTRAVVISHVLWSTGAVMPVRAIADLAHARDALLIVDGAQAAGAIPVDIADLGADAYAFPGQKWLLGPEGTGALAVTRAARERIAPTGSGYMIYEKVDADGSAVLWPNARRYETSNNHRPSVIGLARSIGWLSMYVGLPWIHERGQRLARQTWDRLAAIDGVEMVTPREAMATLVSFRVRGWPAQTVMDELGARVFAIVRIVPLADAVRLSVAAFTTEDEIERLASTVELLAAHTPETVPPRRTLTILGEA
jgi:L-cysteine/cystine lyase